MGGLDHSKFRDASNLYSAILKEHPRYIDCYLRLAAVEVRVRVRVRVRIRFRVRVWVRVRVRVRVRAPVSWPRGV